MEENLHILCAWFENVSTIPSNIQKIKDSIFLKSKALGSIISLSHYLIIIIIIITF